MSTYKELYSEIELLNKQINDLLKINKFKEATKLVKQRDKLQNTIDAKLNK